MTGVQTCALPICGECRKEYGEIINTAAKLSEVGQISDIVDVSDEFIDKTREEARKESERLSASRVYPPSRKKFDKLTDYLIIALLIATVIAAGLIFFIAVKYL